ncbi:MAG: type III-B CRISPR module RAMP protein Cmr6 [Puniceicoccales bacterium]|jgi:CRISPR type III-B/RAMP module RAMP protein Cmr6|nr:type III-B CRISPR module RAMP protein Cmr6 [Puniceicoccales bacterium]
MSQIPITRDYAAAVGEWCERVENRSLLHEKLAFPKNWGDAVKENQASNWSLMRIASNGGKLLNQAAQRLENPGPNVFPEKADNMRAAAKVCSALANSRVGSGLEQTRVAHTNRFLALLRENYAAGGASSALRLVSARLEGRLALNLADGLIQNAGMSLDRIFGLPLIPGSAIKGVTRHTALEELKAANAAGETASLARKLETFARVFGTADNDYSPKNGELRDFAALLEKTNLPRDAKGKPVKDLKGAIVFIQATPTNTAQIVVDLTNVHYPDFYQGREPIAKTEKPIPNYFPAVERGAEFAFPLLFAPPATNTAADIGDTLLDAAERWLRLALEQRGIGAKTAAGYGWFTPKTKAETDAELEAARHAEEERKAAERARIEGEKRAAAEAAAREAEKKAAAEKRRAKENFDNLPPAGQLDAIADDNGRFRQFMEKKFPTLKPEEQADIVRWFASDAGAARWKEIKDYKEKSKKPWTSIFQQLHAAKKAAGLKLP